jgi:hypothetical protein
MSRFAASDWRGHRERRLLRACASRNLAPGRLQLPL